MEADEEELVGLNNIVHEDTTTVSASSAMIVESFSRNAASMDQQQYMHAENHHHHHYHSSDANLWIDMIDELIDLPSAHAFFDPSSNFPSLDLPPSNSPSGSLCNTLHPFFSPSFDNDTDNHPSSSHHHHHNLPPLPNSSSSTSPHPQHMIHKPYSQQPPAPNLPSGRIHKVVSAPQLHHLDPYRQSPALQSSMPQFPFHQQSERLMSTPPEFSRLAAGYNLSSTQKSPMNMGRFDSRRVPRYDPHKLSGLPHSLPSASYLSDHRPGDPIAHPFHEAASVYSSQSTTSAAQLHDTQDSGLQLVHLLLACAEAVAREDFITVKTSLLQLQQLVSTSGDSMQRVAAYFTDALHSRLTGTGRRSYMALRSYDPATADEVLGAYQILYQACPYVKFAHFISNQAIFEAFEGEDRVHIVDLDIIQGYQWPAFIQALASRPGGAPHLRITGVGMPLSAIEETGKRLKELAESLHVPFEFHAVGERLEHLKAYMLHRKVGEALAVNSVNRLHRLLSETTNPLAGILHMIREQAPNIFTLVEQEASHNGPFFLSRFLEALHYYSAIFDSLEATLPRASPERTKVEQLVFAPEITNIVACEGNERLERHEKLGKWRKMMESIGFQSVPLGANAVNQSKLLLGLYPCDGYTLIEDKGCLQLGWQDRPIVGASAWRC